MKKALPLTLILIGTALLITAVIFWIDSSTSAEPQSFGKTLLDWVTLIAGLGASIKGWLDLFNKEKPTPPTTEIDVKGGSPQISTGDHARNIQADTYIENQTVQQAPDPKTPKSLNQLPSPPLDFIGREKELTQLRQNIEKGVVISGVQGMGGIGKTALGLKLAEQIALNYPNGQIYLDLRGAHEQTPLTPEQVMVHVIRSFHPEAALPLDFGELGAMYRSVLSGKKVLLFYDNARDEKQLDSLLPPKSCTLFVTSRQYFTLPGLVAIDLETLAPKDAIELVQEISSRVNHQDADALAKQCGYLPLAIRAAISILLLRPDWSASNLIKRLSENRARFGLVESSLSLSYEVLENNLQRYLRQLGIFARSFDKEEMLAIWDVEEDAVTDEIVGKLLKTSLLNFDKKTKEYEFHDLTHLYLENKFLEDKKSQEVLEKCAENCLIYVDQLIQSIEKHEFEIRKLSDSILGNISLIILNEEIDSMVTILKSLLSSMNQLKRYKILIRPDIVACGNKYYSTNSIQPSLNWEGYITVNHSLPYIFHEIGKFVGVSIVTLGRVRQTQFSLCKHQDRDYSSELKVLIDYLLKACSVLKQLFGDLSDQRC